MISSLPQCRLSVLPLGILASRSTAFVPAHGWQSFVYPYDFNRENAKGGSEVRQVVKDQHRSLEDENLHGKEPEAFGESASHLVKLQI